MKKIEKIKKEFKDQKLFDQALTHKSWLNENPNKRESNERLEFLGDAVLDFLVGKHLYLKLPNKNEGYLTALRASIVNTKNLHLVAEKLDLGKYIFLSKGEEERGGRQGKHILADTVEAIIGAIFLSLGLEKAESFILDNLLQDLEKKLEQPLKDPKSKLQEYCHAKKLPVPKYNLIKSVGLDNDKEFTIEVQIKNQTFGQGVGKTKQEAEQEAASVALESIKE